MHLICGPTSQQQCSIGRPTHDVPGRDVMEIYPRFLLFDFYRLSARYSCRGGKAHFPASRTVKHADLLHTSIANFMGTSPTKKHTQENSFSQLTSWATQRQYLEANSYVEGFALLHTLPHPHSPTPYGAYHLEEDEHITKTQDEVCVYVHLYPGR